MDAQDEIRILLEQIGEDVRSILDILRQQAEAAAAQLAAAADAKAQELREQSYERALSRREPPPAT